MVQDPAKRTGYASDWLSALYPKTYAYLKHFEEPLRSRSGYNRYFDEHDPFYSMFNVSDYTFAPHKVVWREQAAALTAAVLTSEDQQTIVPDHKLMLVALESADEAHFLCAMLNSSPAQFAVLSYSVSIQMDTHILENVCVPVFEPGNHNHRRLANLSVQAHAATAAGDAARVQKIEAEIDGFAARLWGLTDEELWEIQESLEELGQ